jgi:uncharacterized protein YbjT (DUF2867 family)
MNVLLFGATGMVGQGVLRECLLADDVEFVQTLGRTPVTQQHPKLRQVVRADLVDYHGIEDGLRDFDACFFCLGASSFGKSEAEYTRVTCDLTLAAAKSLARLNPQMTFVYVSGAGTDSTEQGRSMWARVKGKTENALLRLPFKAVYLIRPGIIQPLHGIRSKTRIYRLFYSVTKPIMTVARLLLPNVVLTTECIGIAILASVRQAPAKPILETHDIAKLCRRA